ncbi:unnamed protein product [Sphacelaria rigidula]
MRTVLATEALHKWRVGTLNLMQAYLHAPLLKDVWLELSDKMVVKVEKALDGVNRSAVQWFKELRSTILTEDWHNSHYDEYLYFRQAKDRRVAVLPPYVDAVLSRVTTPKRLSVCRHASW